MYFINPARHRRFYVYKYTFLEAVVPVVKFGQGYHRSHARCKTFYILLFKGLGLLCVCRVHHPYILYLIQCTEEIIIDFTSVFAYIICSYIYARTHVMIHAYYNILLYYYTDFRKLMKTPTAVFSCPRHNIFLTTNTNTFTFFLIAC